MLRGIWIAIVVLFWHAVSGAGGFFLYETARALDAANIPVNTLSDIAFVFVMSAPGFIVFIAGLVMSRVYIHNLD